MAKMCPTEMFLPYAVFRNPSVSTYKRQFNLKNTNQSPHIYLIAYAK